MQKGFVISDFHMDTHFRDNSKFTDKNIRQFLKPYLCEADVLFIPGDIATSINYTVRTLQVLSEMYPKIIYCHGNHEFVGVFSLDSWSKVAVISAMVSRENVFYLEGNTNKITEDTLCGGCMGIYDFSYSKKHFGKTLEQMLVLWKDKYDGKNWNLNGSTFYDLYNNEMNKIKNLVRKKHCNIMLTHVGPLAFDIGPEFHKASTGSFYFDGRRILNDMPNDSIWLFGHTHTQKKFNYGNVNLMCNPLGYPWESKNHIISKEQFVFDIL